MLTESEIHDHLRTAIFGKKIHCFESIDSTNAYGKSIALRGCSEGTVVVAEAQTAGRGRFNRKWVSDAEKNLTFSVIVRPKILQQYSGILSLYAGMSVSEAVEDVLLIPPECKWPNDVLLNGRKCCGILSEGVLERGKLTAVVIGIGLNVNQEDFPDDMALKATSLAIVSGRDYDRPPLLARILTKLEKYYAFIQNNDLDAILRQWQTHARIIGKELTVNQPDGSITGIVKRIEKDGGLVLASNNSERKVFAGDVSISQVESE